MRKTDKEAIDKGYLKGLYKREEKNQGGEKPYDSLMMLKAILLGQWHSLSDPQLEHALRVRLDYSLLWRTLCRFRNRLIHSNTLKPLLNEINKQLQKEELMVSQSQCPDAAQKHVCQPAQSSKQNRDTQFTE